MQKGIVYYRCHGPACRRNSIRGDALERNVLANVQRIRLSEMEIRDLRKFVEEEAQAKLATAQELKASANLHLTQLDGRLSRLTDLLVDGAIEKDAFAARREQLLVERQDLVRRASSADQRPSVLKVFEEFELRNRELLSYESMNDDEKRELLDIVCSNWTVAQKKPAFTLHDPYFELALPESDHECAHSWGDVRTRVGNVLRNLRRFADQMHDGS
jgi:hypothetical protein